MTGINPYAAGGLSGWATAAASAQVQAAKIVALPSSLATVAQATNLQGQVSSAHPNGTTVLQTPQGEITVKLPSPLPVGTPIDLQIPAGQPPKDLLLQPALTRALLSPDNQRKSSETQSNAITIDKSASVSTAYQDVKSLQGTAQQAAAMNKPLSALNVQLTDGQTVRLTPLPAAQQFQTLSQGGFRTDGLSTAYHVLSRGIGIQPLISNRWTADLPSPVPISLRILPDTLRYLVSGNRTPRPIISDLQQYGDDSRTTGSSSPSRELTIPATNGQNNTSPSTAAVQKSYDMRVMSVTHPPHIVPPAVPAVSLGNHLSDLAQLTLFSGQNIAVATGYVTDDGNPILQIMFNQGGQETAPQLVSLHYPARNLPAGTQVIFTSLSVSSHSEFMSSQGSWPVMQESLNALQSVLTSTQFQSLMNLFPSPAQAQSFPAAALLFLAAAKGGDLSGWLGDRAIRGLAASSQSTQKNLLQRLSGDISSQSTGRTPTPADPPHVQSSPDWRGYTLPMLLGHDIHAVTLWTRQANPDNDRESDKRERATRFFVDLQLSRMGNVQFDGLIHPSKKSLNLCLITQRPLGMAMQDMLKSVWIKTIDGLGYAGSLTFKEL